MAGFADVIKGIADAVGGFLNPGGNNPGKSSDQINTTVKLTPPGQTPIPVNNNRSSSGEKPGEDRLNKSGSKRFGQVNKTMQLQPVKQAPKDDNTISGEQGAEGAADGVIEIENQTEAAPDLLSGLSQLVGWFGPQQAYAAEPTNEGDENSKPEQINETRKLEKAEPDIDDQVKERFTAEIQPMIATQGGTRYFKDNKTGERITQEQRDQIEAQMRDEYGKRMRGEDTGTEASVTGTTEGAIENVANNAPKLDFSDEAAKYLGDRQMGDFMLNGTIDEWRDFVQALPDFYQGLYDVEGNFDDGAFTDWYNDSKSKSYSDLFSLGEDGLYSAGQALGSDYDTFKDVIGYLYDTNGKIGYGNFAGDFSADERQSVIDALAYEFIANEATRALDNDLNNDFAARFDVNDVNRFLGLDDWEIGSTLDGFRTPDEIGKFNNPMDSRIMETSWISEDGSKQLPVSNAIDNILAAYGQGYGARERKR